jgi:hypothetical protein
MAHSIGRLFGVAAAITALLLVPLGGAAASPIRMDDPPLSWDDVLAAKANAATQQAAVDDITARLGVLEAKATELTNVWLRLGNEYRIATYNLQVATTTANDLQQRADTSAAAAEKARLQVGAIVAQLYKAGGDTTMNLLVKEKDADSLLYRLGTMSQLTDQTTGLRDAAEAASNNAKALKDQAEAALAERDRLEKEAEAKQDAAETAKDDADAQVAANKQTKDTYIAQLATLNDISAQKEKQYDDWQAEEQAREQQIKDQQAKDDAAANGSSGGSSGGSDAGSQADDHATDNGGSGDSSWVPGSDQIASPAQAQNIAANLLGSFGWGGDQMGCLINLWNGESGWRVNAYNPSSGAYGIPQSWPANKMASVADDWPTSAATQITWGLNYIAGAYGSPCNAWYTWSARSPHWY